MSNLPSNADAIEGYTYEARLHAPLFYASSEGTVIETDPVIAATALLHAIGYNYYDLAKPFALAGEAATTPEYDHLLDLPIFTSEMVPIGDHTVSERTFRTVSYTTERAVVSQSPEVGQFLTGSKKPVPRSFEGSRAGWHKMREYVGLPPGTQFEFTVWSPPDAAPPETVGFQAGIKRTGEIRAQRTDSVAETVTLNQYLLQSVYDVDEEMIFKIMDRARDYLRGNDVRTNRFVDVDAEWFAETVAPSIVTASDSK